MPHHRGRRTWPRSRLVELPGFPADSSETAFEEAWEFALLGSSGTLPQPDRGPPMLRTRYISTALAMVVDNWMGHAVPISRLYRRVMPHPEPDDGAFAFHGKCSVMQTDPGGPEPPNLLEVQGRMLRVPPQ